MWAPLPLAQPTDLQQAGPRSKPLAQKALATGTTSGASPEVTGKGKGWTTLLSEPCTRVFTSLSATRHAQQTSETTREGPQASSRGRT